MGSEFEVSKGRLLHERSSRTQIEERRGRSVKGRSHGAKSERRWFRLNEEIELAILFKVPYYLYRSHWSVRK